MKFAKDDPNAWVDDLHPRGSIARLPGMDGPPDQEPPPWVDEPENQQPGPAFTLTPAAQLVEEPRPVPWLVKGLMPAEALGQVFGDPGAGKSLLTLHLAAAVASGAEFHGHAVHRQGPVIYLAGEGHAGLPSRLLSLSIEHDLAVEEAPVFFSSTPVPLDDPALAATVVQAIETLPADPVLIVVDTLHRHLHGDENSAKDIGALIRSLDGLRARFGATVLLVHHTGHGDKARSRGSSAAYGALDFEYRLTRDEALIALSCTKAKDFAEPAPVTLEFAPVKLPWLDEDGEPVWGATLKRSTVKAPDRPRMTDQERRLYGFIRELMRETKMLPPADVLDANRGRLKAGQHVCPLAGENGLKNYVRRRGGITSSDKEDTEARALRRRLQSLQGKGFIEVFGEWCWLADNADKARHE